MPRLKLIKHAKGAPGLRILGLGPYFLPCKGLYQLKKLFDEHAFWANNRKISDLKKLLIGSSVIISIWRDKKIIGFGRATSDGIYRAVLWDIVVADHLQGQGLGRLVVEALLSAEEIKGVERIYLMTTNSTNFYKQLRFKNCKNQNLLIKTNHYLEKTSHTKY